MVNLKQRRWVILTQTQRRFHSMRRRLTLIDFLTQTLTLTQRLNLKPKLRLTLRRLGLVKMRPKD